MSYRNSPCLRRLFSLLPASCATWSRDRWSNKKPSRVSSALPSCTGACRTSASGSCGRKLQASSPAKEHAVIKDSISIPVYQCFNPTSNFLEYAVLILGWIMILQTPACHLICHECRSSKTHPVGHQDGFRAFVDPSLVLASWLLYLVVCLLKWHISRGRVGEWNWTKPVETTKTPRQPWEIHIISLMLRHKCCVLWSKDLPNIWSQHTATVSPHRREIYSRKYSRNKRTENRTVKCKVSSAYQQPLDKFQDVAFI